MGEAPQEVLVHTPSRRRWLVGRLLFRAQVGVDAFGVDLPRHRRRVPWGEVDHVRRPGPDDDVVVLVLQDGRPCRTNLPAAWSRRVAEIGRVPYTH